MLHLEFLLEEPSIQPVVDVILSALSQESPPFTRKFIVHQGKQQLLRQLDRKIRAYSHFIPDDFYLIVIVDQDQEDCYALKERIQREAHLNGIGHKTMTRIVVVMLESWFLGDPQALEAAFPKLARRNLAQKSLYRQPESRPYPADDLDRELKGVGYSGYVKGRDSALIAPHLNLDPDHNRAHSFHVLLAGIHTLLSR
jgi:hypothetical protein